MRAVFCLFWLLFLFGGDGGADLGEGGRNVGRRVVEDDAGVADGDSYELDASSVSSESANEEGIMLYPLSELVLAAEVHAKADLEEDEGAMLTLEGVGVRGAVG
jgi:hypothetical protein